MILAGLLSQLPANELAGMSAANIGGLQLRKKSCYDGLVGFNSLSDIQSCIVVCWSRETVAGADKIVPCRTIGFRDMMADMAFLRCIAGIDIDYRHTSFGRLASEAANAEIFEILLGRLYNVLCITIKNSKNECLPSRSRQLVQVRK